MESSEIERAMLIYLGANQNGGICPTGMEDRIRDKYDDSEAILREIKKTLSVLDEYKPDWSVLTLESAGSEVEADLSRRLPQFSNRLRKAMANFWCYGWR